MSKLRTIPIVESEVLSINELSASHSQEDVLVVPAFIKGESASLIFSKKDNCNYARVGEHKIKVFKSVEEVWEEAELDASFCRESSFYQPAKELVNCLDWWEDWDS